MRFSKTDTVKNCINFGSNEEEEEEKKTNVKYVRHSTFNEMENEKVFEKVEIDYIYMLVAIVHCSSLSQFIKNVLWLVKCILLNKIYGINFV